MFAQGRAVLPHPDLDALMAEARALHAAGPKPRPLTEDGRFKLVDEIMDCRAVVDQPTHALLALAVASRAVDRLYMVNGWWEVKRERWPADLAVKNPEAARELNAVLTASEPDSRQEGLEKLVMRLTGNLIYRDGGTAPAPVP
ncbi:hypothetical protein DAAJ005_12715 [Deinococcus sp. AJ005]|nr:hypothetical protein DAAJ005_12715 [Deinococcus sp. AJ005]